MTILVDGGWAQLTERGLFINSRDINEEQWWELFTKVRGFHDASRFGLGDLWNMRHSLPDSIVDRMRGSELSIKTIQNYGWVARNWPYDVRDPDVSFTHHAILAAVPDNEKVAWLEHIKAQDLDTDDLRAEIVGWQIKDFDRQLLRAPLRALRTMIDAGRRAIARMPAIPEKADIEGIFMQLEHFIERLEKRMDQKEKEAA